MPFYTYDNVPDSPINNFAVLNALNLKSNQVLLESNLRFQTFTTNDTDGATSTVPMPNSGKYYIEVVPHDTLDTYSRIIIGVTADPSKNTISQNYVGLGPDSYSWTARTGVDHGFKSETIFFLENGDSPDYTANAIYQIFYDSDNLKIWMGKNNNWYSSSGLILGTPNFSTDETMQVSADLHQKGMFFIIQCASEVGQVKRVTINFGQDPTFGGAKAPTTTYTGGNEIGQFYYDPPTVNGEKALALCTANLPEGPIKLSQDQTPSDHFKAVIWSGTTYSNATVPVGFTPDFVWAKAKNVNSNHRLVDSVRGGNGSLMYELASNDTRGNGTDSAITGLSNNGINLSSGNFGAVSGQDVVAWCWRAAGSPAENQAKIINEDGTQADTTCAALATAAGASITPSKVSANRQNGFSIVKYNGNSGGGDVPHGLSQKPDMLIVRPLTTTSAWIVWHKGLEELNFNFLYLNTNDSGSSVSNYWGSTGITNTKFGLFAGHTTGGNNYTYAGTSPYPHIAYCWHSVEGYSKFGSYTGNNSADGPFVYCGFRPAFVMIKLTTSTNSWVILDAVRDSYNTNTPSYLYPDLSLNEQIPTAPAIDILSNGFKVKTTNSEINSTSGAYIFMAFSEQPFSGPSNAR